MKNKILKDAAAYLNANTWIMPIVVLVTIVSVIAIFAPDSLNLYSFQVLASESSSLLLLASGQTMIILLGGIDLSNAALASLISIFIALFLPTLSWATPVIVLIIACIAGFFMGALHAKIKLPSFVVTLTGMALFSGFAFTLSNTTIPIYKGYEVIAWLWNKTLGIPNSFTLAIIFMGILEFILRFTKFGRGVYAIGNAELVTILSGVNTSRIKIIAFVISGFFAGLAGLLISARTHTGNPSLADNLLLPAIAAVIIGGSAITGGLGNMARTFVGVICITIFRFGMTILGVNPGFEPVAYGVVLIIAMAITIEREKLVVVK
jgi:ribose transport system permease protein